MGVGCSNKKAYLVDLSKVDLFHEELLKLFMKPGYIFVFALISTETISTANLLFSKFPRNGIQLLSAVEKSFLA